MDINSEEGNLEALCDKHQDSFLRIHVKYEARPKPRTKRNLKRFCLLVDFFGNEISYLYYRPIHQNTFDK